MGDPSILPLFSSSLRNTFSDIDQGSHYQWTKAHPQKGQIFKPDSTTLQLQEKLLEKLASASGSNAEVARGLLQSIDLSKVSFGEELKDFFSVDGDQKLSSKELISGLVRMGESFVSRNREIQQRANCFVVKVLGTAEYLLRGTIANNDLKEAYEKAELLLLVTPSYNYEQIINTSRPADDAADSKFGRDSQLRRPSSKGGDPTKDYNLESSLHKGTSVSNGYHGEDRRESKSSVAVPKLFRSRTTLAADMKRYTTLSSCFLVEPKTSNFMNNFFVDVFKGHDSVNMHSFGDDDFLRMHELWDFFDLSESGTVSRNDLHAGLTSLALHFIAKDAISQNIVNLYMQRKLRHAVATLDRLQEMSEWNNHAPNGAHGTHGTHGAHGAPKVSRPTSASPALLGAFPPGAMAIYTDTDGKGKKCTIKSYLGEGRYKITIGVGAGVIEASENQLTAATESTLRPLSARGTNSELDDVGNPRSPGSLVLSPASSPAKSPARLGSAKTRTSISSSAFSSMNTEEFSAAANPALRDLALNGEESGDGGPASSGGEDEFAFASGTGHNGQGQLPLVMALRTSLGPSFRLNPDRIPSPKFKQDYHLKFGANRQFWFQQCDYGVKFEPFFSLEFVSNPELVTACPSAMETFRCFFLHLGVGIGAHPFVLQVKFRVASERLLSLPDEELVKALFQEHLMSVVTTDSYVEMDVLHAVWPTELNGYRLMLVSFEEVGTKGFYGFKSIVSYTPETGPFDENKQWRGKDVIMTLKDGHFTLLLPHYGDKRNSKPWSDYPIDDLVKAIEDYNTEFSMQPICLLQYQIGPYLHQEGTETTH